MKKTYKYPFSKALIIETLAAQGITIRRSTVNGGRVWILSNGEHYDSMAEIAQKYKIQG